MVTKKSYWWVLVLVVVLLVVGGVAYYFIGGFSAGTSGTGLSSVVARDRDKVTIAMSHDATGIFPEGEDETRTFDVSRHIFDPLVGLDKNLTIKGDLAKSWTTKPDNLTWDFKLYPNVKFQDGTAFTADDVKFSIDTAIKEEWSSGNYLGTVDSATVIDPQTIEIKTKQPDPVLLNELANVLIISKNYKKGDQPNGTGPYKYVSWDKTSHIITLAANPNYFAGEPKVKNVVFSVYASDKDRVDALTSGKADIAQYGLDTNYGDQIKANASLDVRSTDALAVSTIIFNTTDSKSPFSNIKVRQAFYHAIDQSKLAAKVPAGGDSISQIVPKMIFGYNDEIARLDYSPTQSKQLLADAGYGSGLAITLTDVKGQVEAMDNELISELNVAGFTATLNLVDLDTMVKDMTQTKTLDCVRTSWVESTGDAGDTLNSLFHAPDKDGIYGAINQGYSNPALDKLAEEASQTLNQAQRKSLLQQGLKVASDDVAYVPLYVNKSDFGVDKNLSWTPRPDDLIYAFEMAGK